MKSQKKKFPFVTIIVPTYNQVELLDTCIRSLIDQDYQGELEIIVIDNSKEFLLSGFVDKYTQITFLHQPIPGSYNARNKGLEYIDNTDIVAFTDSDCIARRNWVSTAVGLFVTKPDIDYIAGRVEIFLNDQKPPSISELYEKLFAIPQKKFLEEDHYGATANMITKYKVLKEVGLFDGKLKSSGDKEWGQRAWSKGKKGIYNDDVSVLHPARSHNELLNKYQRVCGGIRDREPGYWNCLRFVKMYITPPLYLFKKIINSHSLSLFQKLQLSAYCYYLNFYRIYYRLKLEVFNLPSPR